MRTKENLDIHPSKKKTGLALAALTLLASVVYATSQPPSASPVGVSSADVSAQFTGAVTAADGSAYSGPLAVFVRQGIDSEAEHDHIWGPVDVSASAGAMTLSIELQGFDPALSGKIVAYPYASATLPPLDTVAWLTPQSGAIAREVFDLGLQDPFGIYQVDIPDLGIMNAPQFGGLKIVDPLQPSGSTTIEFWPRDGNLYKGIATSLQNPQTVPLGSQFLIYSWTRPDKIDFSTPTLGGEGLIDGDFRRGRNRVLSLPYHHKVTVSIDSASLGEGATCLFDLSSYAAFVDSTQFTGVTSMLVGSRIQDSAFEGNSDIFDSDPDNYSFENVPPGVYMFEFWSHSDQQAGVPGLIGQITVVPGGPNSFVLP